MHTVTLQPLTAQGELLDFPEVSRHRDLFDALNDAHQKLRMARIAGAVIAVERDSAAWQWLATYEDGENARVTITDDDEARTGVAADAEETRAENPRPEDHDNCTSRAPLSSDATSA